MYEQFPGINSSNSQAHINKQVVEDQKGRKRSPLAVDGEDHYCVQAVCLLPHVTSRSEGSLL